MIETTKIYFPAAVVGIGLIIPRFFLRGDRYLKQLSNKVTLYQQKKTTKVQR